jgi:diacylglycerol kinase
MRGLLLIIKEEPNFRIELTVAILVIGLGYIFKISSIEWIAILLCIGGVLSAEAFNSSIERMADHITLERHPTIGNIKDIAAAAVLIMAVISVVVGVMIFGPRIL